jgi:hypothetical protein
MEKMQRGRGRRRVCYPTTLLNVIVDIRARAEDGQVTEGKIVDADMRLVTQ